jgi:hypothetical protein
MNVLTASLQEAVSGAISADEALSEAHRQINTLLKESE